MHPEREAARCIQYYARRTHQTGEDLETNVCDLLADLMHLCRVKKVSWRRAYPRARANYQTEKLCCRICGRSNFEDLVDGVSGLCFFCLDRMDGRTLLPLTRDDPLEGE